MLSLIINEKILSLLCRLTDQGWPNYDSSHGEGGEAWRADLSAYAYMLLDWFPPAEGRGKPALHLEDRVLGNQGMVVIVGNIS